MLLAERFCISLFYQKFGIQFGWVYFVFTFLERFLLRFLAVHWHVSGAFLLCFCCIWASCLPRLSYVSVAFELRFCCVWALFLLRLRFVSAAFELRFSCAWASFLLRFIGFLVHFCWMTAVFLLRFCNISATNLQQIVFCAYLVPFLLCYLLNVPMSVFQSCSVLK